MCNNFISDSAFIEEIVGNIPENVLTGFQLRDIFDKTNKKSKILKKIYETVLFNKRFAKSLEITKRETVSLVQ